MKHYQAPWFVKFGKTCCIVDKDNRWIADIFGEGSTVIPWRQNANLIAAAPTMLEALERMPCQFEFCKGAEAPFEAMITCFRCAAILKANGKYEVF